METHGRIDSCSYSTELNGSNLRLRFHLLEVDESTQIKEAHAIKLWNFTTPNAACRLRHTGPKFVMAIKIASCFMGIDSDWIDGDRLEGHQCNNQSSVYEEQAHDLTRRSVPYAI